MLKKSLHAFLFCFLCIGLLSAKAQLSVAYHQSDLPFLGIGYTIADRWTPEIRLGSNQYIDLMSVEGILTYQYLQKEDYGLYAGLGVYYNQYEGGESLSIPLGLLIYPFENKAFGFHIEAAPLIGLEVFRGSWGIRYRFLQE